MGGPSYRHRWTRLTGWPVYMVVGGPVELGGLPPYVYCLPHGGSLWVDHAAGAQVGQVSWVTCVCGCRWTSEHGGPPHGWTLWDWGSGLGIRIADLD